MFAVGSQNHWLVMYCSFLLVLPVLNVFGSLIFFISNVDVWVSADALCVTSVRDVIPSFPVLDGLHFYFTGTGSFRSLCKKVISFPLQGGHIGSL